MAEFQKHYQEDGSFQWWETTNGRYVDGPECLTGCYYILSDWLRDGGIPDEIPYFAATELLTPVQQLLNEPDSNLRQDVLNFMGNLQHLVGLGVVLPETLSFTDIAMAINNTWPDDKITALSEGLNLRNLWDEVVYHCGTLKQTNEIFPDLVKEVTKP